MSEKRRLGSFTLDEIKAECDRFKPSCVGCSFYGMGFGSWCGRSAREDMEKEIELTELKKCIECEHCYICTENIFRCVKNGDLIFKSSAACSDFKQKKHYRPFNNTDEFIAEWKRRFSKGYPKNTLPIIWLKMKEPKNDWKYLVTGFCNEAVVINNYGCPIDRILDEFIFLDGSQCGIKTEISE